MWFVSILKHCFYVCVSIPYPLKQKLIENLKTIGIACLAIATVVAISFTILHSLGSLYRSFRIFYVGEEIKALVVDCQKRHQFFPSHSGGNMRYSIRLTLLGWDDKIDVDSKECLSIGSEVKIRFIKEMNDLRVVHGKTVLAQIYHELRVNYYLVFFPVALILLWMLYSFISQSIKSLVKVNGKIKDNYIGEDKPQLFKSAYRYLFVGYNMLPSLMAVIVSVLVIIYAGQLLLLVENMPTVVCGLVLVVLIVYLLFISPHLIYWMYELNFGKNDVVIFFRIAIQMALGVWFAIKLIRSISAEKMSFRLDWETIAGILGF